jgi:hypothetical protein
VFESIVRELGKYLIELSTRCGEEWLKRQKEKMRGRLGVVYAPTLCLISIRKTIMFAAKMFQLVLSNALTYRVAKRIFKQ